MGTALSSWSHHSHRHVWPLTSRLISMKLTARSRGRTLRGREGGAHGPRGRARRTAPPPGPEAAAHPRPPRRSGPPSPGPRGVWDWFPLRVRKWRDSSEPRLSPRPASRRRKREPRARFRFPPPPLPALSPFQESLAPLPPLPSPSSAFATPAFAVSCHPFPPLHPHPHPPPRPLAQLLRSLQPTRGGFATQSCPAPRVTAPHPASQPADSTCLPASRPGRTGVPPPPARPPSLSIAIPSPRPGQCPSHGPGPPGAHPPLSL